jgi:hypothetical protein
LPLTTNLPVLSAKALEEKIFAIISSGDSLSLALFDADLQMKDKIVEFKGSRGFILDAKEDGSLLAVNDRIIAINGRRFEPVLKAHSPVNFFWHSAKFRDSIYVQEYGEIPTGLWRSSCNYTDWRLLTTNVQLDPFSRHFHSVAHDAFRNQLIVTLGDGNSLRVATTNDEGNTWQPLYEGAWQFIPIVPRENKIVFGMDSGLTKSGVGVYYADEDRWEFIFLKWVMRNARFAQMCDLKQLKNGLWLSALGSPRTVLVSKDLKTWHEVFTEGFGEEFEHDMAISEGKDFVTFSTGKSLLLFKISELENVVEGSLPALVSCGAYMDRIKGYFFAMKRKAAHAFF